MGAADDSPGGSGVRGGELRGVFQSRLRQNDRGLVHVQLRGHHLVALCTPGACVPIKITTVSPPFGRTPVLLASRDAHVTVDARAQIAQVHVEAAPGEPDLRLHLGGSVGAGLEGEYWVTERGAGADRDHGTFSLRALV